MEKIIYETKGRAKEYAEYGFSAFVGCSNVCSYCYLRKGRFAKILGGCTPTLKKCFKNEEHALEVFKKEVKANLGELQEKGLFFSFTTDWALSECIELHKKAIDFCVDNQISVKLLTKRADFIDKIMED